MGVLGKEHVVRHVVREREERGGRSLCEWQIQLGGTGQDCTSGPELAVTCCCCARRVNGCGDAVINNEMWILNCDSAIQLLQLHPLQQSSVMDVDEIFPRLTAYPALVDSQECGRSFATGKPQIVLVTNHRMKIKLQCNQTPQQVSTFREATAIFVLLQSHANSTFHVYRRSNDDRVLSKYIITSKTPPCTMHIHDWTMLIPPWSVYMM